MYHICFTIEINLALFNSVVSKFFWGEKEIEIEREREREREGESEREEERKRE